MNEMAKMGWLIVGFIIGWFILGPAIVHWAG